MNRFQGTTIARWINPPVYLDDKERTHRAALLNIINLAYLAALLLLFLVVLVNPVYSPAIKFIDLGILLVSIVTRVWIFQGKLQTAAYTTVIASLFLLTAAVISLGTVNTPTSALFICVVVVSGILFGKRGIFLTSVYSTLTIGILILLEMTGVISGRQYSVDSIYFVMYLLMFIVVGALSNYSLEETQTALKRSQAEIKERQQVETELVTSQVRLNEVNEQLAVHIAEVELLQIELLEQAIHDPLTGLYNRRHLAAAIHREMARSRRDGSPLSVILGDIDFFKRINDSFGHHTGDECLIETARLIKASVRTSDFVCRYGGEEFLILLPGMDAEFARDRAEAIRGLIENLTLPQFGHDFNCSISFGVADFSDPFQTPEELIDRADKALYQSKVNGRNRTTIWKS